MRNFSNFTKGIIAFYLFSIGYAIITQRPFFADGAHNFLKILEIQSFIYTNIFARAHAMYVYYFIPLILIKIFHVKNLDFLSYAFGFGLYLPQLVSLLICYFLTRKNNIHFMLFPVIALFGITMNLSFIIFHESHLINNIFWPILFYLILKENFCWKDSALLLLLGVIFMRSYETAAILGTLLIILLVGIIRQRWQGALVKTRMIWILMLVIFSASVIIATNSIISPDIPANRASFIYSFHNLLRHWMALLSIGYIILISLCLFKPDFVRTSLYRYITVLLVAFTIFISLTPIFVPSLMRPDLHYHARAFMTYMLPFLSVVAYLVMRNIVTVPDFAWRKVWVLVAFLALSQITWHVFATSQWNGFRQIFKGELAAHNGFVRAEDTMLVKDNVGIQLIRPLTWPWTNPTLSILWSKDQDVSTIISISSIDWPFDWQPFNPSVVSELPRVEGFGFSLEKYRQGLSEK